MNDVSELDSDEYKYVAHSVTGGNLEVYKEEFQTDNIIVPPRGYLGGGSVFIGLNEYIERQDLEENSHLILYMTERDLRDFDEENMYSRLSTMRLSGHTRNLQIIDFCFYNCNFGEISDGGIGAGVIAQTNRHFYLIQCFIERFEIRNDLEPPTPYSCKECHVNYLVQDNVNRAKFSFENNVINQLVTSAQSIHLKDVIIKLFHHRNLDTVNITADNSKILFERKILKRIHKEDESGYWNTFNHLHTYVKSLNSEKLEIEKYIAYFSSRSDPIKKALFTFHGGYTKIVFPSILMLLCLLGTFYFTNYCLGYSDNTMATVAYPVDFFKNVILKDFSFENKFSWLKFGLFFVELAYIFSFFCFGLAIRKRWGFKIWK
jgi:hypothetical protein